MQFHIYGLLIGVAMWLGIWLVQRKVERQEIAGQLNDFLIGVTLVCGVIGARLWHVMTDWPLYASQLSAVILIWQGGLSVIGGVAGGIVGAYIVTRLDRRSISFRQLLDASVFGLPFAQAVGRLGNYFNQELYGPPTTLPWAVTIEPAKRLPGKETISTYHPLFLYELIPLVLFGLLVWKLSSGPEGRVRTQRYPLGSGVWFASYMLYYAILRFCLDFWRQDRSALLTEWLGFNQVVLLGIGCVSLAFLLKKLSTSKQLDSR